MGNGDEGIEIVYGENKIFCTGPTRAAKAELKFLVAALQALQNKQGRTSFFCTLWVAIHLNFNSQQGPPFSSLSGYNPLQPPPPPLSADGAGREGKKWVKLNW